MNKIINQLRIYKMNNKIHKIYKLNLQNWKILINRDYQRMNPYNYNFNKLNKIQILKKNKIQNN